MGKLTISMAIFNSFLYVYQRVCSSATRMISRGCWKFCCHKRCVCKWGSLFVWHKYGYWKHVAKLLDLRVPYFETNPNLRPTYANHNCGSACDTVQHLGFWRTENTKKAIIRWRVDILKMYKSNTRCCPHNYFTSYTIIQPNTIIHIYINGLYTICIIVYFNICYIYNLYCIYIYIHMYY